MATSFDVAHKAKAWFDVIWNQGRLDRIDEFVTDGSVAHLETGDCSARDAFRALHAQFRTAFPDLKITVEDTVVQDNNVVVRWLFSGTHQGHGFGPPTNQPATARGMTWMTFDGDTIAEGWDCWNYSGMLAALHGQPIS